MRLRLAVGGLTCSRWPAGRGGLALSSSDYFFVFMKSLYLFMWFRLSDICFGEFMDDLKMFGWLQYLITY